MRIVKGREIKLGVIEKFLTLLLRKKDLFVIGSFLYELII